MRQNFRKTEIRLQTRWIWKSHSQWHKAENQYSTIAVLWVDTTWNYANKIMIEHPIASEGWMQECSVFLSFFWRTCCLTKAASQMWIRVKSQKAWNQLSVLITCRWQTCLQLEDSHTEISDDDGFLQKTESTEQEVF